MAEKIKVLLLNLNFHHKNYEALINYKNFEITSSNNLELINNFDYIYSPSKPIDVKYFANKKFIFGPHFSVFPDLNQLKLISGNNSVYIQPSLWVNELWLNKLKNIDIDININIKTCPFGVNTIKFKPEYNLNEKNDEVFIYHKARKPEELEFVKLFLNNKNIKYKIFSYNQRYNENDYINCLKKAKYGIWLDAHESQGFALQEALSYNVPLLVWNVKSLNQEYRSNYEDIFATTIPYWDNKCGEFFYEENELDQKFNIFIERLENYKPREYILENLTYEKCGDILENIFLNI